MPEDGGGLRPDQIDDEPGAVGLRQTGQLPQQHPFSGGGRRRRGTAGALHEPAQQRRHQLSGHRRHVQPYGDHERGIRADGRVEQRQSVLGGDGRQTGGGHPLDVGLRHAPGHSGGLCPQSPGK
ncbi:hypothetical protein Aple_058530 [Acrocarpospora pleiomorpha]|uniref:Uncharacterized protein n=1 Tax=Acrocarpospora pleiomorpha TaxID=90975 RepID=A0A5M3XNZ6_9ACTN|nr:hypothetical protein Aple_058530 [Acrocarpospora pleiomorpha]